MSNPHTEAARPLVVVGAGIVGISCALYLQRDGHAVTVLDPAPPGEGGASFGNAAVLAVDHCAPNTHPGILREVPGYLRDPLGPLTIRWRYLPRIAPWLWRYVRNGRPERFHAICRALQSLHTHSLAAWEPLLDDAGAQGLIRRQGWMTVWESEAAFRKARHKKVELARQYGVRVEELDGAAAREREPALTPAVRHAVYYPDVAHTVDPLQLVQALAGYFQRQGGRILRERVRGFTLGPEGVQAVQTETGVHPAAGVVLAAGAWSRELARQLGVRVPLDTERGYHATLPDPGVTLRMPFISGDFHCAITPLAGGLRVAGSIEFAGLHAPPNEARVDKLLTVAKRALPGLNDAGHTRWLGFRPSMPDALPVLGRSPRHANAYLAFGHGQVGLTDGPLTGRLIADLVAGRTPPIDLAPFRAERF